MTLVFDGIEYRTIADVKDQFKVSEKSLRKWIKEGHLPEPKKEAQGGRTFRNYDEVWCEKLNDFLTKKRNS